jgi:hypothetical protein
MPEHKPDCGCASCSSSRQRQAREAEEARQAEQAEQEPGRPHPWPSSAQIAAMLQEPARGGPAQSTSSPWSGSPDHDERVTRALVRDASDSELSTIRQQVAAEYRDRAAGRQAQRQSGVMWRTRTGELVTDGSPAVIGASYGPSGAPVQRSQVNPNVPELGSEQA